MSKFFLILSLLLTPVISFSNDGDLLRFTSFEVLTDENKTLEFSSVLEQKEWKAVSGEIFTGGYFHAAYWLKLTLNAPENESLLLTVIMTILDDVQLYAPLELVDENAKVAPKPATVSNWVVWQQGDLFPFENREKNWRGFSFALKARDKKPYTVYLRVVSTSTHLIYPQLWRVQEFVDYQKNETLLLGFASGIMFVLLLSALGFYFVTKKTLQKYYLALMILTICHLFVINGFVAQWLLKDYPVIASNLVGVIVGLLQIPAFGFHREFLFGKLQHLLVYRLQSVIMLFGLITAIFSAIGKYNVVAELFSLSIFVSLFIVFFIVVYMRLKNKLSNIVFLIYCLLLPANLITLIGLLGANTTTSWLSIYGTQIGSLINLAILISITLLHTYKTISNNQIAISQVQLDAKAAQSQRYWMAMLTHEIKTPLSVINASCQSMGLFKLEPAMQTRLQKIKRNVTRIDNLVKHFLGNDEVPVRLQHLHKVKIDLYKWLNAQLNLFDEAAQKRWRVNVSKNLTIFADSDLLAIALNNLLTNSLKYSSKNSIIEIGVTQHKHQNKNGVLLFVKDFGIPISSEKRDSLFIRFQLSEYVGNGVGLWACQEIARAHGGDVWLDDKRADGNTFNIWLPIKKEGFNAEL